MPYIAIKGFPKDDETVRKVAKRINAALLDLWGCRQEHINISYEAVPPEKWDERIEHGEIEQNRDKMLILGGKWTSREKKLTILHLDDCPYCHKARRALDELCEENPAYRGVAVEWIEEERESEAAILLCPHDLRGRRKALRGAPRRRLRDDQVRGQSCAGRGSLTRFRTTSILPQEDITVSNDLIPQGNILLYSGEDGLGKSGVIRKFRIPEFSNHSTQSRREENAT